ncbi:hypothetical protein LFWB_4110 [Candidatus Phytoplasma luffae]|uniref:Effector n=1 Tax=Loofah witches'-broom phytoplasma TaxID=35773 RepID=A0A975ILZ5_LOWBP|nr:hypothetical protein [Candidatus Phytoplasma luffae]QTX02924.1 hypothetical protein LFWB_3540 [Candidatus Phytoplasma luffae]QTX02977.1 hypothetical protein LFWB_4110 [Candidatus Phytoplasma luffae]
MNQNIKNNNKRNTIIILIFSIIIISFFSYIFLTKNSQDETPRKHLSSLGQTPEKDSLEPEEKKHPQPKIKTTQKRFNQIKSYIFAEPLTNYLSLPTDLSEREKEIITLINKMWRLSLGNLNVQKALIDESQNKFDKYQSETNLTTTKITYLEQSKKTLEKQKEDKEKEIKQNQEEQNLASPDDKIRLQAKIEKLEDEVIKIVGKIDNINTVILNLKVFYKLQQDMLTDEEKNKRILQEKYKTDEEKYIDLVLSRLNELYDITSAEE